MHPHDEHAHRADANALIERMYVASLQAPRSRATMRRCVGKLAQLGGGDWLALAQDKYAVLRLVRALDGYALNTKRTHVAALRGLLRAAEADARIIAAARVHGRPQPAGRALSGPELDRVRGAARTARDLAMVELLASGLRISEALGLDVADYRSGLVLVRRGKGSRSRSVALTPNASAAVAVVVDGTSGPLLRTRDGDRMSVRGASKVLASIAQRAGVSFTAHDLRRTCITRALAAGAPVEAVAAHVGHRDVQTTISYHRPDPLQQTALVAAALVRG